jgi:Helicase associated domain
LVDQFLDIGSLCICLCSLFFLEPQTPNNEFLLTFSSWNCHQLLCLCENTRTRRYKTFTGHANVPWRYEPDPKLQEWVHTQRKMHNKGTLRKDREELLERMGFVWTARDAPPETKSSRSRCSGKMKTIDKVDSDEKEGEQAQQQQDRNDAEVDECGYDSQEPNFYYYTDPRGIHDM